MFGSIRPFSQRYRALESDEEDEKLGLSSERQQVWAKSRSRYRIVFLGLISVNVAVLLWIAFPIVVEFGRHQKTSLEPQRILENFQHNVPVIFQPDDRFETLHPEQNNDDPWQDLLPPGRGFIELPIYESSKDGSLAPGSGHYAISMYHQLHCLASLQSAFTMLTTPSDPEKHKDHDKHGLEHLPHCFDYLRQAIMCSGDTSLEEAVVVPGLQSGGLPTRNVDGWGVTHLCRNWEALWEFAKNHRYRNSSGII